MQSWLEAYGREQDAFDAIVEASDLSLLLEAARRKDFETVLARLVEGNADIALRMGLEADTPEVSSFGELDGRCEVVSITPGKSSELVERKEGDNDAGMKMVMLDEGSSVQVVCSVTSTIYHRTDCEKAKRISKTELFDSPEAAEQAGKRSCLACKPKG